MSIDYTCDTILYYELFTFQRARAESRLMLHKLDEALQDADKAISITPHSADVNFPVAKILSS